MAKAKALSKVQAEVLALLQSGEWELGESVARLSGSRYWLQKGGVGRGGESREVRWSTAKALIDAGLIEAPYAFPTLKYRLTEKGRQS